VYILSLKKIGNSHVSNLLRFCNWIIPKLFLYGPN
jgi:hypothetical protein